jgi:hypothetical protein
MMKAGVDGQPTMNALVSLILTLKLHFCKLV